MTKSQVNKLGKEIRNKLRAKQDLIEEDLINLQAYRTSFKEDLAPVFEEISRLSRNKRRDSIVSFRIKRIESILSKIKREPTMALGNMGDIAGCRVILYSEKALIEIVESINKKYNVKSYNDYTLKCKDDGYKGYHLYIESPIDPNKLLEIQLRTISTHKWASLVEIIDVILNLKLKEGEMNEPLQRFLKLLSLDRYSLTIEQKKEIIDIDDRYNIYKILNEVFSKNNLSIRKSWLELSKRIDNFYFIIEVDSDKKSTIISIKNYKEAESKYFDMFLSNKNSNFVLTYIVNPDYKKICIAYSSYILIKHDYLQNWSFFAKDIIEYNKTRKDNSELIYADLIKRNLDDQHESLNSELRELDQQIKDYDQLDSVGIFGLEEWIDEINERNKDVKEFQNQISKSKIRTRKNIFEKIFR